MNRSNNAAEETAFCSLTSTHLSLPHFGFRQPSLSSTPSPTDWFILQRYPDFPVSRCAIPCFLSRPVLPSETSLSLHHLDTLESVPFRERSYEPWEFAKAAEKWVFAPLLQTWLRQEGTPAVLEPRVRGLWQLVWNHLCALVLMRGRATRGRGGREETLLLRASIALTSFIFPGNTLLLP